MTVPHSWELLELDGGHVGMYSIYRCRRCHATGHPNPDLNPGYGPPRMGIIFRFRDVAWHDQFLACGCGPAVTDMSDDCDEALAWFERHQEVCRWPGRY